MSLISIFIFVFINSIGIDYKSDCILSSHLFEQAKLIERKFEEPVMENGFLVDKRISAFKEFERVCITSYFNEHSNTLTDDERATLLKLIKKVYFYTRSSHLISSYKSFISKYSHKSKAENNYIKSIYTFDNYEKPMSGMTLLDSSGQVFSIDNKDVIVIISSAQCKFSMALMDWFNKENFDKKIDVIWGYKYPIEFSPAEFFKSDANKIFSVFIDIEKWSSILLWETPTIYHLKNGIIVAQSVGFTEQSKQFLRSRLNSNNEKTKN